MNINSQREDFNMKKEDTVNIKTVLSGKYWKGKIKYK